MAVKVKFAITSEGNMIAAMIGSLKGRRAAIRKDTHVTAVSCIMHAIVHGDVTLATRLLQVSEHAGKALQKWFVAKGPLSWVETEGTDAKGKSKKTMGFKLNQATIEKFKIRIAKDEVGLVKELSEVDYHDFDPPKTFEGFDLFEKLGIMLKGASRIEKDEAKAKHEATNLEGLTEMRDLYNLLKSKRNAAEPIDEDGTPPIVVPPVDAAPDQVGSLH